MSDGLSTVWFNRLLFGGHDGPVPEALRDTADRLESEGVNWRELAKRGGLVDFYSKIHADLHDVLDHFENGHSVPLFRTRAAESFFRHLSILMARRDESTLLPHRTHRTDIETLDAILSGSGERLEYVDARFWGETARHILNHRRPIKRLDPVEAKDDQRLAWLYDVSCQSLGRPFDPLTRVLVPASDHVDAVHWSSPLLLEAFVLSRPNHPLSTAVGGIVRRSVKDLLDGRRPRCARKYDAATDTFLSNVRVVHRSIGNAKTSERAPPKTIDVFQRLLALAEQDHLWKDDVQEPPDGPFPVELLRLSERLKVAERQIEVLTELLSKA